MKALLTALALGGLPAARSSNVPWAKVLVAAPKVRQKLANAKVAREAANEAREKATTKGFLRGPNVTRSAAKEAAQRENAAKKAAHLVELAEKAEAAAKNAERAKGGADEKREGKKAKDAQENFDDAVHGAWRSGATAAAMVAALAAGASFTRNEEKSPNKAKSWQMDPRYSSIATNANGNPVPLFKGIGPYRVKGLNEVDQEEKQEIQNAIVANLGELNGQNEDAYQVAAKKIRNRIELARKCTGPKCGNKWAGVTSSPVMPNDFRVWGNGTGTFMFPKNTSAGGGTRRKGRRRGTRRGR